MCSDLGDKSLLLYSSSAQRLGNEETVIWFEYDPVNDWLTVVHLIKCPPSIKTRCSNPKWPSHFGVGWQVIILQLFTTPDMWHLMWFYAFPDFMVMVAGSPFPV